jgi:hypothetical protein
MKATQRIRVSVLGLVALFLISFAAKSYASAVDMFLKIEDEKGKITKVAIKSDGTFQTPPLKAGTYSFSWGVSQQGIRESPTRGSAGRESSAPSISEIACSYEIQTAREASSGMASGKMATIAPRDMATGQASGKRQHKPLTIRKEIDRSSGSPSSDLGKIVVDEDCDGITGSVSFKSTDGKTMGMDDWSTQVK